MDPERWYEEKFGRFPLTNIAYYLVIGQVAAYLLTGFYPGLREAMLLRGQSVVAGEWWRVFTLLFVPSDGGSLFIVLQWYFMYVLGMALEQIWGAFRFTLYLAIAYLATLIASILFPATAFSNGFIYSSLFLAFAHLNPDFTVMVFFIIPVRIKWLAILMWLGIVQSVVFGGIGTGVHALLQIINFLVFFGNDIRQSMTDRVKRTTIVSSQSVMKPKTYMQCITCHATELDRKIFYWCHECHPEQCYCDDHIKSHKHKIVN